MNNSKIVLPEHLNFEVQVKSGIKANHPGSVENPSRLPCFVLNHNDNWNDYGYYNWYALFYFTEEGEKILIEEFKLITSNEGEAFGYIEKGFESLDDKYCSIGLTVEYYKKLYYLFGSTGAKRVLAALRDCATNVNVRNVFKDEPEFQISMKRSLDTEKIFREAKMIVNGNSLQDSFKFSYHFTPEFNKSINVQWDVSYEYDSLPMERYVGIIGENGMGKTLLLKTMIKDLMSESKSNFIHYPSFSSVIVVNSTPFDGYGEICSSEWTMPYAACSLEQNREDCYSLTKNAIAKIFRRGIVNKTIIASLYFEAIAKVIPSINIDELFYQEKTNYNGNPVCVWRCNWVNLKRMMDYFSSGQLHLFMLVSQIISHVELNTLFILDEPEVHLHPKAIMELQNVLCFILSKFDCFAIFATHSPLVVREMLGHNVFMVGRSKDRDFELNRLPFETFGENIAVLYQKIFKYDENFSLFTIMTRQMVSEGKGYNDIVKTLNHGMELSMNALMTINNEVIKAQKR